MPSHTSDDDQKQKEALLEIARQKFEPSLQTVLGQPAFILREGADDLVPGARVTAVLFLSRFVDMFGDLIAKGNYDAQQYIERNKERNFQIDEQFFRQRIR